MASPNLGLRLVTAMALRSQTCFSGQMLMYCSRGTVNEQLLKITQYVSQLQSRTLHTTTNLGKADLKNSKKKFLKPPRPRHRSIKLDVATIYNNMTVAEVAGAINKDVDHVFEVLTFVKDGGRYHKETSVIKDIKVIMDIVKKSGMRSKIGSKVVFKPAENKDVIRQPAPDPSQLVRRPPIVTIMGHVDHGKTTLLDALRKSNIVDQEFGGITQHIGAFSVKLSSEESIMFLDTPGHAAFFAMRARGALLTDIVVLVVAADDGVMNQTRESIQHAKDANVPIIVAINKIDRPAADVERTKQMLLEQQLIVEDFGGDVQAVPISALKGTNLDTLQDAIFTLSEMMDLKADPLGLVEGRIIESQTHLGRGKIATVVIQRGTLKPGSFLVAGTAWAKVRGMYDDQGVQIKVARSAVPVQLTGWDSLPSPGDELLQVQSMQELRDVVKWRLEQVQLSKQDTDHEVIGLKRQEHDLEHQKKLQERLASGFRTYSKQKQGDKQKEVMVTHDGPQLAIVLKGDVDGSLEAIMDTIETYPAKKCRLDLVHYGVGNVTESDVELAEAFNGEIFCFNVDTPASVVRAAASKSVPIRRHNVIYKLFDDLIMSLTARLPAKMEEEVMGEAEVKAIFEITDGKQKVAVAGCRCTKGTLRRKGNFKVFRGEDLIYEGDISSMKHMKNEVDIVKNNIECGISVRDKSVTFQPGDVIRCYSSKEVTQAIDWEPGF